MKRIMVCEIETCHDCLFFKFVDEGWASHNYCCTKLDISTHLISDPESGINAEAEIENWFSKKCPFEVKKE